MAGAFRLDEGCAFTLAASDTGPTFDKSWVRYNINKSFLLVNRIITIYIKYLVWFDILKKLLIAEWNIKIQVTTIIA